MLWISAELLMMRAIASNTSPSLVPSGNQLGRDACREPAMPSEEVGDEVQRLADALDHVGVAA